MFENLAENMRSGQEVQRGEHFDGQHVLFGAAYEQAAKQAGYATRSGAYKAYWKALDGRMADTLDQHRALELERLHALQAAVWDAAMAGDVKAVGLVLRIIEQRSRLLGLDKPGKEFGAQTVVMSPADLAAWKETQEWDRRAADDGDAHGAA